MDMNTITTLLGSYAFPIIMCLVLFYYLQEEQKSHKEEMENLRKTLEDNTKILTELKTLFEGLKK